MRTAFVGRSPTPRIDDEDENAKTPGRIALPGAETTKNGQRRAARAPDEAAPRKLELGVRRSRRNASSPALRFSSSELPVCIAR